MESQDIELFQTFEDIRKEKDGVEFWLARDLQKVLGYTEWRNFERAVNKAKESLEVSSGSALYHFVDVNKMVELGAWTQREIQDIMLTRYACYLIAINWDIKKPQIAFAQSYFVTQARSFEVLQQKMEEMERLSEREKQSYVEKEFHKIAFERGVDGKWISKIISIWDKILFGGNDTQSMKDKYWIDQKRALADFLPTVLINAKWLATGITNINVGKKNLTWANTIWMEHAQNNYAVRDLLKKRWITPEDLDPCEDIKMVERRHKKEEKALLKATKQKKLKK